MSGGENWRDYASALLDELRQAGLAADPRLCDAFLNVPRHRFIDGIQVHDPTRRGRNSWSWQPSPDIPDAEWLTRVYQDQTIVVRVDDAGMPISANTAPWLALWMLELLDVRPGDRVLEIGTGTGHLTALISYLAGARGRVVSLEIDPEVARTARKRLGALLPGASVEIIEADAGSLPRPDDQFTAVVSTASCWPAPAQWFQALVPGGRACLEYLGGISAALLLAKRAETGSSDRLGAGRLVRNRAGFMPLRSAVSSARSGLTLADGFGFSEFARIPADGLGKRQINSHPFDWYCQLELPDASLVTINSGPDGQEEPFLVADGGLDMVWLPDDGSAPDGELVSYGGTASLLDRLRVAWQGWHANGQPGLTDYAVVIGHDGRQEIMLEKDNKRWQL